MKKSNVYFHCLQKSEHLMQKQHPEPHISLILLRYWQKASIFSVL